MAGFFDTIRGDGLIRVERALADLEEDPQRLDHARVRFDDSPPPYTSDRSGTTTRSQSPNPPSEEQQLRHERQTQLALDRDASKPYDQFRHQRSDEEERIFEADLNGTHRLRAGDEPSRMAYENVKKRWIEQGIWNNKWTMYSLGRWKHEEPLQLESESETDSEVASPPLFSFSMKQPQPKPRLPKSDEEKRRIAERRVVQEREREASRPYQQFVYQISKERERIQDESTIRERADTTDTADINTRAYENVKNTWSKRGIWNKKWGIVPGMSWKHEEPLEEECVDSPAPIQANPVENGSYEVERAPFFKSLSGRPLRYISGSPVTDPTKSGIFIRSPSVETNNHQVSGAMNISQYGPTADIDSAGIENGDAKPSSSAPNFPRLRTGKRVLRPATRQSRRKSSLKGSQLQPVVGASLGPVHPLKVLKAAAKKKSRSRRQSKVLQEVSSSGPLLLSGPDVAEPLHQTTSTPPRKSTQIQLSKSSLPNNATGITSTNSLEGSRPWQKAAGSVKCIGSAKPQGVTKRRSTKTTRGMSRKDDT